MMYRKEFGEVVIDIREGQYADYSFDPEIHPADAFRYVQIKGERIDHLKVGLVLDKESDYFEVWCGACQRLWVTRQDLSGFSLVDGCDSYQDNIEQYCLQHKDCPRKQLLEAL